MIGKPKPKDDDDDDAEAAKRQARERWRSMSLDEKIRYKGYRIKSRPSDSGPVWEQGGTEYSQVSVVKREGL